MKIFNPLQELDTSPDSKFVKAVDFVVQDIIPDRYIRKSVPLGRTPLVLQLCEIEIGDMRTTYGAIEKSISEFINRPNDKGRYKHIHNIDPELLKQIPAKICDPIAIIQSQTVASYSSAQNQKKYTKPNGLVILIELTEKQTINRQEFFSPVIAAIHIKQKDRGEWDLNITSVHGRKSEFIVDNLSSNLLMYLNREKCHQMLQTHFTPSVVRRMYPDNDRHKRLQIIREMCSTEIHKDRSLKTGVTTMEARSYIKESGHLLSSDNTPKPTLMQAIKEKISPKQPKRTIPTPTDYKTEDDLRRFYQEIKQKPLTKEQAKLVGRDMISQVKEMNHTDFIEVFNNHIETIYNNKGDTNIQSIQNAIQKMAKQMPDILKAQQTQERTPPEKEPPKDKGDGGRER